MRAAFDAQYATLEPWPVIPATEPMFTMIGSGAASSNDRNAQIVANDRANW